MFKYKRFFLCSLFILIFIFNLVSTANAYRTKKGGMVCCSEAVVEFEIGGLKNVTKDPVVFKASLSADVISVLCDNPAGRSKEANGTPFNKLVSSDTIFDDDEIVAHNGNETVTDNFDLEVVFNLDDLCTGKGKKEWTVRGDSAWLLEATIFGQIFSCLGDPETDDTPCIDEDNGGALLIGEIPEADGELKCLVPDGLDRDEDGNPPHAVNYECFATTTGNDISFVDVGNVEDLIQADTFRFSLFEDGPDRTIEVITESGLNDGEYDTVTAGNKSITVEHKGGPNGIQTEDADDAGEVTVREIP